MSKKNRTALGGIALLAAGIAGVMPGTAGQATPTAAGAQQAQQTTSRSERAALPVAQSARAAFGISMMGGGYDPGMFRVAASGPWMAPRYNQRKARRDARRANRGVRR